MVKDEFASLAKELEEKRKGIPDSFVVNPSYYWPLKVMLMESALPKSQFADLMGFKVVEKDYVPKGRALLLGGGKLVGILNLETGEITTINNPFILTLFP